MPSIQIRRTALLLVCALGALLLFSGSALAAGEPIIECCVTHKGKSINEDEFSVNVNPNGASTAVTWEYRLSTGSEKWEPETTTAAKNIGSGTKGVLTTALSGGITPGAVGYEYRATASNSLGTVHSEINKFTSPKWELAGGSKGSSAFTTKGTATAKITWPGLATTIECKVSFGSGILGGLYTEDNALVHLENCITRLSNHESPACKPEEPLDVSINGKFELEGGFLIKWPNPLCTLNPEKRFGVGEPFHVAMAFETLSTKQAVTMTKTILFGAYAGTMTLSQEFALSGAHLGEKFGAFGG